MTSVPLSFIKFAISAAAPCAWATTNPYPGVIITFCASDNAANAPSWGGRSEKLYMRGGRGVLVQLSVE